MKRNLNSRLNGLRSTQLRVLAKQALRMAKMLEDQAPSYQLAIDSGIIDESYHTPSCGWIAKYSGEAIITMDNGAEWKAVGVPPSGKGCPYNYKDGYISFHKLSIGSSLK